MADYPAVARPPPRPPSLTAQVKRAGFPRPQSGLKGRRVLITAGQRDPICPPTETEVFAQYLVAQRADVRVEWHPGGHEIAQSELGAIQAFLA